MQKAIRNKEADLHMAIFTDANYWSWLMANPKTDAWRARWLPLWNFYWLRSIDDLRGTLVHKENLAFSFTHKDFEKLGEFEHLVSRFRNCDPPLFGHLNHMRFGHELIVPGEFVLDTSHTYVSVMDRDPNNNLHRVTYRDGSYVHERAKDLFNHYSSY